LKELCFTALQQLKVFYKKNKPACVAYCIGESTAKEARKYFKEVQVAKIPTVESVIELVNQNYISKCYGKK
jgi:uroporphyrinogen-III synthase